MFSYVCQPGPSTETMNLSNLGVRAAAGVPDVLEHAGDLAERPDRRARARDPVTASGKQERIAEEEPNQDSVTVLADCRSDGGAGAADAAHRSRSEYPARPP